MLPSLLSLILHGLSPLTIISETTRYLMLCLCRSNKAVLCGPQLTALFEISMGFFSYKIAHFSIHCLLISIPDMHSEYLHVSSSELILNN